MIERSRLQKDGTKILEEDKKALKAKAKEIINSDRKRFTEEECEILKKAGYMPDPVD